MNDGELRRQLAELVVEALEVDGKQETSILDELFAAFGLNFQDILVRTPQGGSFWKQRRRSEATTRLAGAAPSAASLLNELVRQGGDLMNMVEDVYARLAKHGATTTKTSKTFRFKRGQIREDTLTISKAFLELVRELHKTLQAIDVEVVDSSLLSGFLIPDNGEFFGISPAREQQNFRLADAILHLAWLVPRIQELAASDRDWVQPGHGATAAREAAEALVDSAGAVVAAEFALRKRARGNSPAAAKTARRGIDTIPMDALSVESLGTLDVLAMPVEGGVVYGIEKLSRVGLDEDLHPFQAATGEHHDPDGPVGALAGFVAMWRAGNWASSSRDWQDHVLSDPAACSAWLEQVRVGCQQTTVWLATSVLTVEQQTAHTLKEVLTQFLNLPLWRQRSLLYEIWVLCTTLTASEDAGWTVQLNGVDGAGDWDLQQKPTSAPVALIAVAGRADLSLEIWREPKIFARTAGVDVVDHITPDVAVLMPGSVGRPLILVEAKDQHDQSLGDVTAGSKARAPQSAGSRRRRKKHDRSALGVAGHYARTAEPLITWICNYGEFRKESDPGRNYAGTGSAIHVAARFRSGNVPAAFSESVRNVLTSRL